MNNIIISLYSSTVGPKLLFRHAILNLLVALYFIGDTHNRHALRFGNASLRSQSMAYLPVSLIPNEGLTTPVLDGYAGMP